MGTLKRIAPIFPVSDINLSLEYYGRLGFDTRAYEKGGYGYVTCDGIEVHIGLSPQVSRSPPSSAYLWVEDADELAQKWTSAGADVRLPEDTDWGEHEGVLIDGRQPDSVRLSDQRRDRGNPASRILLSCLAVPEPYGN